MPELWLQPTYPGTQNLSIEEWIQRYCHVRKFSPCRTLEIPSGLHHRPLHMLRDLVRDPKPLALEDPNAGALIIRIGFWGI